MKSKLEKIVYTVQYIQYEYTKYRTINTGTSIIVAETQLSVYTSTVLANNSNTLFLFTLYLVLCVVWVQY